MKKSLLVIDRGSREPDVGEELLKICSLVKEKAGYDYSNYCFLEVLPPNIEQGIRKCVENDSDSITIIPYFLYPGLKLKEAIKQSAQIAKNQNLRIAIARPLCYHYLLTQLIRERIEQAKVEHNIQYADKNCDVLVIGHGSSDTRAREAFIYTIDTMRPFYQSVNFCFLELDEPTIEEGIRKVLLTQPKTMLIMPYFLHKGSHIKYDVINEVNLVLKKNNYNKAFMTKHLGVHAKLIDLILQRAEEVEKRTGIK